MILLFLVLRSRGVLQKSGVGLGGGTVEWDCGFQLLHHLTNFQSFLRDLRHFKRKLFKHTFHESKLSHEAF